MTNKRDQLLFPFYNFMTKLNRDFEVFLKISKINKTLRISYILLRKFLSDEPFPRYFK